MPNRFKPVMTRPSIRSVMLSAVENEGTMTPQASAYRLRQQLEIRQVEKALKGKDIESKSMSLPW